MNNDKLKQIAERLPRTRRQFEIEIEAACFEIIAIAKEISPAIGEISVDEAKIALIKEFTKRIGAMDLRR